MTEQFYTAWHYLMEHSMFTRNHGSPDFLGCLEIAVVKIDPALNEVNDSDSLNTKVEVWLECGPFDLDLDAPTHDYRLDCGADTFEEAIIKLAELVKQYYPVEEPVNTEQ